MQLKYKYFTSQRPRCCLAAPRWFHLRGGIADADAREGKRRRNGNANVAKEAQKFRWGTKRRKPFQGICSRQLGDLLKAVPEAPGVGEF